MGDRLKQLYQRSNKASQVNLLKKLCQLSMLDFDDDVGFFFNLGNPPLKNLL